jgi:hypothetical protein
MMEFLYLNTVITLYSSPVYFYETEGTGVYEDCKHVHCNHSLDNVSMTSYASIVEINSKTYVIS